MAQTSNMTTHGALLKELYTLPPVRALNDKSFLHDKLAKEQAVTDTSGKYARFPVTLRRALGRGSRADGGELPTAISEVVEDAKVYVKYNYYALEWTEAIEEASKNNEGAFEKVVTMKMRNVATDLSKDINRQFYNPATGALATCSATSSGSTDITVASAQYLTVGDLVDVVTLSTGTAVTNGTRREITGIVRSTGVVSLADSGGNLSVTSAVGLVVTGNYGNEIEGLQSITGTARTLHGINSSTYEEWNGQVLDASSATAGESLFEQLYDNVGARGRGDIDTYLTTRGVRRRLADEFASKRQYLNEKAVDIHAGYRMIEVNGVETVIDDDCPKKHVFALSKDALKVLQLTAPGFLETEAGNGALIELKDASTAGRKVSAWQAWYRYHCTIAALDPGRTGKIINCADDAV